MGFANWLRNLISSSKKKANDAVNGVKNTVQNAVTGAQDIAQGTVDAVHNTVQGISNTAQNAANTAKKTAQNIAVGYGDWINGTADKVENAVSDVKAQAQNISDGVTQKAGEVREQFNSAAENAVSSATDAAVNIYQDASVAAKNAKEKATQEANALYDRSSATAAELADNIKKQASETTEQLYDKASAAAGNITEDLLKRGNKVVSNAGEHVTQVADSAAAAIKSKISDVSQGISDTVNDANVRVQSAVGANAPETEPLTPPTNDEQGNSPSSSTAIVNEHTQSSAPSTEVQTPSSSTEDEHIDSYEEWLTKNDERYEYIRDETVKHYDEQNKQALAAIDAAKASADAHALDVKETTDKALAEQKDAAYKSADDTLAGELEHNDNVYKALIESITEQMKSGKISAAEAKDLLLQMALEERDTSYEAAEKARAEADASADIAEQRAIVDSSSAHKQNVAEYGAKADALGRMGLSSGGYSDWLNAAAYAQQRAETQAARAQNANAKRESSYSEYLARLDADSRYNDKKYTAESEYLAKLADIDTTYRTNMLGAETSKLEADRAAQREAENAKKTADNTDRSARLENEITYKGYLYDNEMSARNETLSANKAAEDGKFNAELGYLEAIMNNGRELAEYKQSLANGGAEAEEKKIQIYGELITAANTGAYNAEQVASLAKAFGLNDDQVQLLTDAANTYESKVQKSDTDVANDESRNVYTQLLGSVNNGTYTAEQVKYLAEKWGLPDNDIAKLAEAAEKYAASNSNATADAQAAQNSKTFIGLLGSVNNGEYDATQIKAIAADLGLSDTQTELLVASAEKYATRVSDETSAADQNYLNGVYSELLNAANNGGYTSDQVKDLAKRLGLDENAQKTLGDAAAAYEGKISASENNSIYTQLLGSANNGTYTEEQIANLASRFGLSDTEIAQLKKAAQTYTTNNTNATAADAELQQKKTFLDVLNGVLTGAYDSATASALATEFGLSDTQKKAITDAASGKAGEYTREIYTELMGVANQGGYTSAQIADLADAYGLTPEQKKDLVDAATSYEGKTSSNEKNSVFANLLAKVKDGTYTGEQAKIIAKMHGLDETKDKSLIDELVTAANNYATSNTKDENLQKASTFASLLNDANNGVYTAAQVEELAKQLGFDPANEADSAKITMLKNAASGKAGEYTREIYTELMGVANQGGYTSAQIADLADAYGLTPEQKKDLVEAAASYEGKISADEKKAVFTNLLDAVNSGRYTASQANIIAKMYGFDETADKDMIDQLTTAADTYAASNSKDESIQMASTFAGLLSDANNGVYTAAQVEELAKQLGFDPVKDQAKIDMLKSAANTYATNLETATTESKATQKAKTFIELLASANSGEFNAAQIAEIASQLGFDPEDEDDAGKISMLTDAATEYATNASDATDKADTDYKNSVYAELLDITNQGGYTAEQVRNLAERFGLDSDAANELAEAADVYKTKSESEKTEITEGNYTQNKIEIRNNYLTEDTTDEEIDEYVEDDLISETEAEELKEDRNTIAVNSLNDLVKSGDLTGACSKADELYERGVIDKNTYQKTYFDASLKNCGEAKTLDDIMQIDAELWNLYNSGKMNAADYGRVKEYLYQVNSGVLDSSKYEFDKSKHPMMIASTLKLNGKTYVFSFKTGKVGANEVNTLNDILEYNPGSHEIVMLDGTLYYRHDSSTWYKVADNGGLYDAYNKECGYNATASLPEHFDVTSYNHTNPTPNGTLR